MSPKNFHRNLKVPAAAILYLFISLPLFAFPAKGQPGTKAPGITGDVKINLKQENIAAKLKYDYVALAAPEPEIKFYLSENFNVRRVECRTCQSFKFEREAKPLPTLTISLKKPLAKNERLALEIDYDGSLQGMYHKEHNFLELGLDWFWYPVHTDIGQVDFLYRLKVKTDVPGFQIVSNGRTRKQGANWLIESKVPDSDINLVLSDALNFKTHRQDGYDLQIVSKNLSDEAAAQLLAGIKETLDFYNSTFGAGDPQREVTAVFRPFPAIEGQGGYFRKGYFILPKTEDVRQLLFPVSHELAHYWWLNADQRNAWLNESFAEYSAMLVLRRKQGVEAYDKMLRQKRAGSANLPAVYGFDRTKNRQQTPGVFYRKGVVKLGELESELGEQKFMEFFRKAAEAKINETDKLIELLAQVASRETAERFLAKLKE